MLKYVLIRISFVVPVFLLIGMAVFFISDLAPGDKVREYLDLYGTSSSTHSQIAVEDYEKTAKILHLDKPVFYFSIKPRLFPDTLYKLIHPGDRKMALMFLNESVPWHQTSAIIGAVNDLEKIANHFESVHIKETPQLKTGLEALVNSSSLSEFDDNFLDLKKISVSSDSLEKFKNGTDKLSALIGKRKIADRSLLDFLPDFKWHGSENRFHKWFGKLIKFDFGTSVIDGRNVSDKIKDAFPLTFAYVLLAYFFSFLIAIPFGIMAAYFRRNKLLKLLEVVFSAIYSVPLFWLGTLAVIFFTTSEVIGFLNVFPSVGVGFLDPNDALITQVLRALPHLILPSLIVAFHSGAYLSMLIKRNLDNEMSNQYFVSLLAKGIPKSRAVMNHAFPNSILSLVTVIIMGFPAALAGSVVVEVIFNIPGMGRLLYDSILRNDWNVVFAIVIIIGIITYLFYLAGDLIYHYLNPKIRYS